MSFRVRARRLVAAMRLAVEGPPLSRLIRLLRRGRTSGREYTDLCLQLGLTRRAEAALARVPSSDSFPSLAIRLAVLQGRTDLALEQARKLATRLPDALVSRREVDAVVSSVAPLCAETALTVIRASGRPHHAEPALLMRFGDAAASARRLDELGPALGPQRWLLWANRQDSPPAQLEGLNRYLASHRLAPVRLRDDARALSVGNIGSREAANARQQAGRISVVMTCFDCAPYVDVAIRSVLDQTHRDLELIVVDDASGDDTWDRLVAAVAGDGRVKAIRLRSNVGTYAAKNVGLSLARGDFLAFQDADDWSCPERLAASLEILRRRPWVQGVVCEYVRLQDDGQFWSSLVWPLQRRTPNSLLFRRRVLDRLGFFDEHRFGSDSEYVARLQAGFGPRSLHRLGVPLIVAARRDNSLMTATSTGLDRSGRSQARIDFQEAWTEQLLDRCLTAQSHHRAAGAGSAALIAETRQVTP